MTKSRGRIAIVDDDASVCRALRRLIRSLGMDAETFPSAREFLDRVAALPPFDMDCLILDVHMPRMSGLELQTRLGRAGRPIIFITAHDDRDARDQALAAGALAFLHKPLDEASLIESLERALAPK